MELPPAPPTVPELVLAPELAAIILLEHALDVVREALLAEHPTLIDDFHRPGDEGRVVAGANTICLRAIALGEILRRYRRDVRDAMTATENAKDDEDIPF